MATPDETVVVAGASNEPRSLAIAEAGITNGNEFARCMSALMSDILASRVTPQMGNAVCSAGGKLLKVVELQLRYGSAKQPNGERILNLTPAIDIGVDEKK